MVDKYITYIFSCYLKIVSRLFNYIQKYFYNNKDYHHDALF